MFAAILRASSLVTPTGFILEINVASFCPPLSTTTKQAGPFSFANCSVALRSSSGSVRCIKHNHPDHRDKSEGHKRGPRHELLPVVRLWTEPPNLSVTTVTTLSQDQCFVPNAPLSSPAAVS